MGFQVFAGRSRPATSPGKPVFGAVPKPASDSICHNVADGSDSAIFAAPVFSAVMGSALRTLGAPPDAPGDNVILPADVAAIREET